jgi:hypothetical protein
MSSRSRAAASRTPPPFAETKALSHIDLIERQLTGIRIGSAKGNRRKELVLLDSKVN